LKYSANERANGMELHEWIPRDLGQLQRRP
jgi:hypothetical protein